MYERFLGRIADDGRRKIEAIQSFGEDKILFVKGRTDSRKENPVHVADKGCAVVMFILPLSLFQDPLHRKFSARYVIL